MSFGERIPKLIHEDDLLGLLLETAWRSYKHAEFRRFTNEELKRCIALTAERRDKFGEELANMFEAGVLSDEEAFRMRHLLAVYDEQGTDVQILVHRFFDQANYQHAMKGFPALGPHWGMVAEERRAPYRCFVEKVFMAIGPVQQEPVAMG